MPEHTDCNHLKPTMKSDEFSLAYPNLTQSIWLLFLLMLAFVVLALAVTIAGLKIEDDFLLGILSLASFAAILVYVYRRTDLDWDYVRRLFNTDFDLRVWPCVAISVVGLGMLDTELMKVVIRLVAVPEWMQEIYRSEILRRTSFPSAVFGAVVVAPLSEELLFRGILLSGLLAHYTRVSAVVWTSVLFGVIHFDLWRLVPIVISGVVWAWWVIRTGSLLPALFGHALNNLIAVTILHFYTRHLDISGDINEVAFNPWWWSASGVALTALGLWWFHRVSTNTQHISEGQDPPADAAGDAI
ncbi:MAG: type II CAAX endopeptidase family protein [Gemmatimonadota bacterium]|nr:type II CAAX endopeptidase family protein [Gemmatimonadota bacterium]